MSAAALDVAAGPRAGRDGWLRLSFERRGPRTVVTRSAWTLPLQVLSPVALDDQASVVSILNPTGGLVGGDDLAIDLDVGPGAHACVTTPSATKVYRTAGAPARQAVRVRLQRDAVLEWVPDHTIPFAGSALHQAFDVDVAPGATLFLIDAFACGRVARGERWRFAALESSLTARDGEGLIVHDRFALRPGWMDAEGLGLTEGHPYFATALVVTDRDTDGLAHLLAGPIDGAVAAVGRLPRRGAVVRCLAVGAPELETVVGAVWRAVRRSILAAPPLDLRKT